jgi:putative FmdB family regulatory protein
VNQIYGNIEIFSLVFCPLYRREVIMPTYEYRCKSCQHRFEVFQSMTADPITVCPKCGADVERLIGTGAGPIFKGNGFYQTDYKKSSSGTSKSKVEDTSSEKQPAEKKEMTKKSAE